MSVGTGKPAEPTELQVAAFYIALGTGAENARTAEQLADALDLSGGLENRKRKVRLLAEHASKVWLIAADDRGYFRPATPEEMEPTIRRFASQQRHMAERLRHIRAMLLAEFKVEQISLL